jgi:hypothetical protein
VHDGAGELARLSGLVCVLGRGRVRQALGVTEAEVALVAVLAAIRTNVEKVMEQKLHRAVPSGPADGRASTVWTTCGSRKGKHGPHLSIWPRQQIYTTEAGWERRISNLEYAADRFESRSVGFTR